MAAARLLDPGRYYKLGLELADHVALNDDARSIFLSGDFPELDGRALDKAIATLATSNEQRAYMILDDRVLLDGAGHYLIYGSEHRCGIAASLSGSTSRDYRQALKRFGTPTIFTVRVPIGRPTVAECGVQLRAARRSPAGQPAVASRFGYLSKPPREL